MAYKTYVKKTGEGNISYIMNKAIIEILKEKGELSQPKIQSILRKPPYKNRVKNTKGDKVTTISRMGLWKILDKLEKQGEIEKIVLDGSLGYQISPKSKIIAEIQGDHFQANFKNNMFRNEEKLMKEFQSTKHEKNIIDSLIQFFGFYVLGSLLASRMINKKQRSQWLRPVLDLERGNSTSVFFDNLLGNNEKALKEMVFVLKQNYKLNMAILGKCIENGIDSNQKIKDLPFSKEAIDFVNERDRGK